MLRVPQHDNLALISSLGEKLRSVFEKRHDACIDYMRIKFGSAVTNQNLHCVFRLIGRTVRTQRTERFSGISNGKHARFSGNCSAGKSARISAAVKAFMVLIDCFCDRPGKLYMADYLISARACPFTSSRSAAFNADGFDRISPGTWIFPMSCTSAAARIPSLTCPGR